jgi:hypothetical protein
MGGIVYLLMAEQNDPVKNFYLLGYGDGKDKDRKRKRKVCNMYKLSYNCGYYDGKADLAPKYKIEN